MLKLDGFCSVLLILLLVVTSFDYLCSQPIRQPASHSLDDNSSQSTPIDKRNFSPAKSEFFKKLFDKLMFSNFRRAKRFLFPNPHEACVLGLGMGYICHAYSITRFTQSQRGYQDPRGPGK